MTGFVLNKLDDNKLRITIPDRTEYADMRKEVCHLLGISKHGHYTSDILWTLFARRPHDNDALHRVFWGYLEHSLGNGWGTTDPVTMGDLVDESCVYIFDRNDTYIDDEYREMLTAIYYHPEHKEWAELATLFDIIATGKSIWTRHTY